MIPQDFIDRLLERVDIVNDVIGVEVKLTKHGQNYKGLCPFHKEKTPSFSVSSDQQYYHCFGCKASGNAIKFLMEHRNISFVEAVTQIANICGETLPTSNQQYQPSFTVEYDILEQATLFFQKKVQNLAARKWISNRGLSAEVIKNYRIGYAENSWEQCLEHFQNLHQHHKYQLKEKQSLEQMMASISLLSFNETKQSYYDRFRHRLIFPISDKRGKTVGFGGRVINDQDQPKYLNSSASELFNKSEIIYGAYQYVKSRSKADYLLIVEGYMDVCALASQSIDNVVATMGTAVTSQQITMLFKLNKRLVVCFDGDQAGRGATMRFLQNALPLLEQNRMIKFVLLPKGSDPDEVVKKGGSDQLLQMVGNALSLNQYLFKIFLSKVDTNSADELSSAIYSILQLIAKIPNLTTRELILTQLAKKTDVKYKNLELRLEEIQQKSRVAQLAKTKPSPKNTTDKSTQQQVVTQTLDTDLKRHTQLILLAIINHPTLVDVFSELQHFDTQLFDINDSERILINALQRDLRVATNRDYLTTNAYLNTLNQEAEPFSPTFILVQQIMDNYNFAKQIVQQNLEKVLKSYLTKTLKSQIMAFNLSDDNFEKDTMKQQLKQINSLDYKQLSKIYRQINP